MHPENTMEAYFAAAANGADMIELDVKVTRDGYAVVVHDHTLQRIWGDLRNVIDLTWSEIQSIQSGSYRLPLFEEVINRVQLPFMVDFDEPRAVDAMVDVLRRQESLERFLVVTGDVESLARVKQLLPEVTMGLTWSSPVLPDDALLQRLGVRYFNPYYALLNERVIDHMRHRNLLVSCWTVDDESHMHSLVNAGVDYIVSNRLSTLVNLLNRS